MIDSHDVSIPQLIRVVEEHPSGADDEVLIQSVIDIEIDSSPWWQRSS
jgi:hypothetical protein